MIAHIPTVSKPDQDKEYTKSYRVEIKRVFHVLKYSTDNYTSKYKVCQIREDISIA